MDEQGNNTINTSQSIYANAKLSGPTDNLKYGVVIGKFSKCWHLAHQSLVDKVREDGLIPVIFIGSSQHFGTPHCPLHVQDRMKMIQLVNPGIQTYAIEDKDCWAEWHQQLVESIELVLTKDLDEVTIYTHDKPEDLHEHFHFKGEDYYNEYYSKIFEVEGMHTTNLPISDIAIRGTRVHEDLEGNKHFLDPKVYRFLKYLGDPKMTCPNCGFSESVNLWHNAEWVHEGCPHCDCYDFENTDVWKTFIKTHHA